MEMMVKKEILMMFMMMVMSWYDMVMKGSVPANYNVDVVGH